MKFLLLSALVALCAVTRLWCQETEPREEADYWSSDQVQVGFRSKAAAGVFKGSLKVGFTLKKKQLNSNLNVSLEQTDASGLMT